MNFDEDMEKELERQINRFLEMDNIEVRIFDNLGKHEVYATFKLGEVRNYTMAEFEGLTTKFLTQLYESRLTEDLHKKIGELENLHTKIEEIHDYIKREESDE